MNHIKDKNQFKIEKYSKDLTAVLIIDFQTDFIEYYKGSLTVPDTNNNYVESINKFSSKLANYGFFIYASQDWHPKDHISFASNHEKKSPFEKILVANKEQTLWPDHCIQNTTGAQIRLPSDINFSSIKKGMFSKHESYSVFADESRRKNKFCHELKEKGIKNLIIFGLALDFCVKETIFDAVKLGFNVTLIESLCRGVDSMLCKKLIYQFKEIGVKICQHSK